MNVATWSIGMSDEQDQLTRLIQERLRITGDGVVLVMPDKDLEAVGEQCLIATHGVSDRKTFGKVCMQTVLGILLRPALNKNFVLSSDNTQPVS
jgi:hypothetical protein